MKNTGNKIVNILIGLFIIGIVVYFCSLGIQYYNSTCEMYNTALVNFTVELIKGNKSLDDISSLDVNDSVKETLTNYYNSHFYSEDEYVVIFDNVILLEDIIEKANQIQQLCLIDGKLNSEMYYTKVDEMYSYFVNMPTGEDLEYENYLKTIPNIADKKIEYILYYSFTNELMNVNYSFKIENNNLLLKVLDLTFDNGEMLVNYKGMLFSIYQDGLVKKIQTELKNSWSYQSIKISNIVESQDRYIYTLVDDLQNSYTFYVEMKLNKIKNVLF